MLKKQIPKNLLSKYFATGLGMLLGLFLIPFLIKKLGNDAFGLISLSESLIVFIEIATIGIRLALSRHATFCFAKGKKGDFIEYISTGRYLLFGSAVIILIIGLLISCNFPNIFRVPTMYAVHSKILFSLITISFVITTINIVFWSVLYVKQRLDLVNIASSSGLVLRAVGIFIAFSILPKKYISLVTYGIIYLIMTCTREYIVYIWHRKIMPDLKIAFKHFKTTKVIDIFSFGIFSTVSYISSVLNIHAATIIVNVFWGTGLNAIYAVGLKFPRIMSRLFLESTWILTPTFTDLVAKNDKVRLKTLFFGYTKIMSITIIPICFILIFFAKPIISIWVGEGFIETVKILQINIIPLLIALPFSTGGCITNAYAKVKVPSIITLSSAVLNVILCILLGKVFALALIGIALASAISYLLPAALFWPYYSCKIAGFSVAEYWVKTFIAPFIWANVVFVGFFSLVKIKNFSLSSGNFLVLSLMIISIFLFALIYYFGAYALLLNQKEKGYIKQIILKKVLSKTHINFKQADSYDDRTI